MGKEILTFADIEIKKNKNFYRYKSHVPLRDIEIEKVLVSNKISFGEKNYKYLMINLYNDDKFKSLHIMLPETSAYKKVMMCKLNECIFD